MARVGGETACLHLRCYYLCKVLSTVKLSSDVIDPVKLSRWDLRDDVLRRTFTSNSKLPSGAYYMVLKTQRIHRFIFGLRTVTSIRVWLLRSENADAVHRLCLFFPFSTCLSVRPSVRPPVTSRAHAAYRHGYGTRASVCSG